MTSSLSRFNRRQFLINSGKLGAAVALTSMTSYASSKPKLPAVTSITEFSATQLSEAIRSRQVSCVEVMQAYLARIDKLNPTYNAIVNRQDSDDLIAQARAADQALTKGYYFGWMHGMPHAIKDLSDVKGMTTTMGSPILKNNVAKADSIFVERIRNQGAIFIGKTNVSEFGLGSHSYNPVYGVTRNAYDKDLCAGGSSGGAACGLALQLLPVADGGDMMGSLRNPAAYNNVIGFRPSLGRVPSNDSNFFYQQLGLFGPMGRNSEDTRRLLATMAGYDSRAPMSLRDKVPSDGIKTPLSNYRIGWMGDYNGYLETEAGVLDLCTQSLSALSEHGLVVEDCHPDYDLGRLWQTWLTLRHWTIAGSAHAMYNNPALRALMKPEAVWEVEGGLNQTGLEITKAGVARVDWYNALNQLFKKYDFLALPSAQVFAFDVELNWPKKINDREMDTYHRWMEVVIGATLASCPSLNLPVGFDAKGRAMGMQLLGPIGSEDKLLNFAAAYEKQSNYLQVRPQLNT